MHFLWLHNFTSIGISYIAYIENTENKPRPKHKTRMLRLSDI